MNEPERPPALIAMSSDHAAAVLATVVFVTLGLAREVVGSVEFTWVAVSAQLGPGRMAGDSSLLPGIFWCLHWLMGDVMWAGRALGVLSGVSIVVFCTRLFGPWAGLWAMAQISILTGVLLADPTLPALALLMATLSFGRRGQSTLAGVCAAIAVGCGSWTWPPVLYAIWIARHRRRVLLVLTVGIVLLFFQGVQVVPEVSLEVDLPDFAERFSWDWTLVLGAASLIWGTLRRGRPSRFLSGLVFTSVLGALLIPGAPENLVHLQLLLALGVAAVETGPALLLLGLITLGIRLPDVYTPTPEEAGREQVIAAMSGRQGKAMCTTRTFVRASDDGWLRPCVGLDSLAADPTAWRPEDVLLGAKSLGARWVAVENEAVLTRYFNLQPLLEDVLPKGFTRVTSAPGWQVFSLETDPRPEP